MFALRSGSEKQPRVQDRGGEAGREIGGIDLIFSQGDEMTRLCYGSMLVIALLPAMLMAQTEADCDYDGSGTVDFPDFLAFASAYGSDEARFDLNGDGRVDFPDFLGFARVFGREVASFAGQRSLSAALPGGETMGFVKIEPGTFMMGTTPEQKLLLQAREQWTSAYENEFPQHPVTISRGFYMGRYEVTQAQWKAVMDTAPWLGRPYQPDYPVVKVSWEDAQEFIRRLNDAAGGQVYRLPTEAEWEYACRAGTGTIWFCGDTVKRLNEYAWYCDPTNVISGGEELKFNYGYGYWESIELYVGAKAPQQVGTKKPNAWGVCDMPGNVRGWVQDLYSELYYAFSPAADPPGSDKGSDRMIRGGYYMLPADQVRSAYREHTPPTTTTDYIGFRLVREIP